MATGIELKFKPVSKQAFFPGSVAFVRTFEDGIFIGVMNEIVGRARRIVGSEVHLVEHIQDFTL